MRQQGVQRTGGGATWHTRTSSAFTFCTRPALTVCALAAAAGLRPGKAEAPREAGTRVRLLRRLTTRGSTHPRRVVDILGLDTAENAHRRTAGSEKPEGRGSHVSKTKTLSQMRATAVQCCGLPAEHAATTCRRAAAYNFFSLDHKRVLCSAGAASLRRRVCCLAWTRVTDASSGRDYFWNKSTGETAWEVPVSAPNAAATAGHASNEALLELFLEYILTPAAKFDYPMPSASFMVRLTRLRLQPLCSDTCYRSRSRSRSPGPGGGTQARDLQA